MSSGQPVATASRRSSILRDTRDPGPIMGATEVRALPRMHVALCRSQVFIYILLSLMLPMRVDGWKREAPMLSIQMRIPPETKKPDPYYRTDFECKNYTHTIINVTGTFDTLIEECEDVTREVHPPYPFRPAPTLHASEFDTLDNNATFNKFLAIGCWQHPFRLTLDEMYGAVRANVSCLNATVTHYGADNTSWNSSYWDCLGGLSPDDDDTPYTGLTWDPNNCTIACGIHLFELAAMNGVDCWCLQNRSDLNQVALGTTPERCSTECSPTYFNGTAKFCGGPLNHYSIYEQFTQIAQTSQGTLDPFRQIWYFVVTIEKHLYPFRTSYGDWNKGFIWFLHASSTKTGESLFPFHLQLEGPLYGIQYQLVNSSIIGYELPYWDQTTWYMANQKRINAAWAPVLVKHEMDSGDITNVFWRPKEVIGTLDLGVAGSQATWAQGITTVDSINNVYFVTLPQVNYPFNDYKNYLTVIYGFAMSKNAERVLQQGMGAYHVIDIQADSKFHWLYATLSIPGDQDRNGGVYVVKCGYSIMNIRWPTNPFEEIETTLQFTWTFPVNQNFEQDSAHVVNQPLFLNLDNITEKYYQIGAGSLDTEENTTFVVYKDLPDADANYMTKNVLYANSNFTHNPQGTEPNKEAKAGGPRATTYNSVAGAYGEKLYEPRGASLKDVDTTGVGGIWVTNPDPIYPWFRPRLEYLRFNLNGDQLEAKFQNFTNGGIQPTDANGDTLPDKVYDWGEAQMGLRNCSDMFGPNASSFFLDQPFCSCEWYFNDTIRIYLTDVETVYLGDPIDFKNSTIYGYLAALGSWTFAAYGIYPTQLPDPLYPPVVEVFSMLNGIANVDFSYSPEDTVPMCARSDVDALNSYWHGGTPVYSWYVRKIFCEYFDAYGFTGEFKPNTTLLMRYVGELMNKSVGAEWTYRGRGLKRISFPPHSVLEPGCQYTMELNVLGRWGLSTTVPYLLKKRGPPGVDGWTPPCDYHCNEATCEPPSECIAGLEPGPLTGPGVIGERFCVCDENRFGLFCDGICPSCSPYRTFGCDDGRMGGGVCICKIGYAGDYCDQKLEYWATEWSPCLPCGAAVGVQFRVMKCTNIVTEEIVNNSRCPGAAPLTEQNCKPPLCPCGPPPQIIDGNNVTIAKNCPEVLSGATCAGVCQTGFSVIGEFRCEAGEYAEVAECVAAGLPVLTSPAITFNLRLNGIATNLSADDYLTEIAFSLRLSVMEMVKPVEVQFPEVEIILRIRSIPPSGNRTLAGRRLEDTESTAPPDGEMEDGLLNFGSESPLEDVERALNTTSRWRAWEEVYFRNKANSSASPVLPDVSSDYMPMQKLGETNFSGHRASPAKLVGLSDMSLPISLDKASTSIATRLMAQRSSGSNSNQVVDQESYLGRRLQALANFQIVVTIALQDSSAQAIAMSKIATLKDNPASFGAIFTKFYLASCTKPCQGLPGTWEATTPSVSQVYIPASQSPRANTTTTTRAPPPPPLPPPPPSDAKFSYGIVLGVGIGLFIILAPIGVFAGVYLWRLKVKKANAIAEMPALPPVPARQWEAKWEMPESAKMLTANGELLNGHERRDWQGGGTYEGQVKDGIREGDGRMLWPNGKSYAGQWVAGRPHGHGLLHAPGEKGWTYNGQFTDGQRHGLGRCESFSRRIWYDGQWNAGVQSGLGENGNLPALQGRTNIPPPVAHIWRMEQGEQQEHIAISKVAPDKQNLIGLALEANVEDYMRLSGFEHMPGGTLGPPESPLQMYSRLWGICFGRPDDWLASSWGALVITRIMDDGALARWNVWHVRDMGSKAHAIEPNALIWRVNGVEGDIGLMAQELCAEDDRRRLQLAISNPPHVRFNAQANFLKRPGGQMPGMPSLEAPQTLWFNRPSGTPPLPKNGSPSQPRRGRSPEMRAPGYGQTGPLGDLRRAALENLASSNLPDAPYGTMPAPPSLPPGAPPHAPPPMLALGARPSQMSNLPALPALPDIGSNRASRQSRMSNQGGLPALPDVPQHLSKVSLPPPPPNMTRPPPGRPLPPGGFPEATVGPPPKAPNLPPRIGYRAVVAATRAARDQGLPDARQEQLDGYRQYPDPPG